MSPLRLSDVVDPDSVRGVEVRGRGLNVALFGRALGAIPLGRGRLFIAGLGRGVGAALGRTRRRAALGRPRRLGFQERLQVCHAVHADQTTRRRSTPGRRHWRPTPGDLQALSG